MTTWEYGYFCVIGTLGPEETSADGQRVRATGPTVYIGIEADKQWRIEGCSSILNAMNELGSQGWFIDRRNAKSVAPHPETRALALQVPQAEEVNTACAFQYLMQRATDPSGPGSAS